MFVKSYDYEWDPRDTADLSFLPNCSALLSIPISISISLFVIHAYTYIHIYPSFVSLPFKLSSALGCRILPAPQADVPFVLVEKIPR